MAGGMLNSLGLGGGGSTSSGSKRVTRADLQKMEMKGGVAARKKFQTHTKQRWKKGVGEKIKIKNLGTMAADELMEEIITDITKRGLSGYKGKQLEKKLYKEMGVDRETRRRIMTELGKMYVKKSDQGLSPEQMKKNVKAGNAMNEMYQSAAGKLTNSRKKEGVKKKFNTDSSHAVDSSRIDAKQAKYKIGIAGNMKSEGDFRGVGVNSQQGVEKSQFGLSSTDATVGVAGDFGVPQKGDSDTMGMFKRFGQAGGYQMKKVG